MQTLECDLMDFRHPITSFTMPAIHTWLQAQTEQIDDKQS